MKAIFSPTYGPPGSVELREVPRPEPKKGQLLIRVHAAAVTSGDARLRAARFPAGMNVMARLAFGITGPRHPVLGASFAGVVEVAPEGARFNAGQRVFGMTDGSVGAHAEFVAVKPTCALAEMPDDMPMDIAAAISFGGTTAMDFLTVKTQTKEDDRVLILGAAGQVGVAAIQVAKFQGAVVTAVCSRPKFELVRELGADHAIDYKVQDVTQSDQTYDIVLDCVGASNFKSCRPILNRNGRYISISGDLGDMLGGLKRPDKLGRRTVTGVAAERSKDLETLAKWWTDGFFDPVVSKRFSIADAAKAHALVDTGRKVGSVVLEMV